VPFEKHLNTVVPAGFDYSDVCDANRFLLPLSAVDSALG
jgi:hypothetical protein